MIHLLVLALILTGCEAELEIKACTGGWFEFTCKCKMKCPTIDVKNPRRHITSTTVNTWEQDENISLYHDTENKVLRVKVTTLTSADSGDYKCKIKKKSTKVELKLKNGGCQEPLHQTVYATATTTVTCNYTPKDEYVFFFCKEEGSDCVDVFPTQSASWSNGKFTKTEIESGFSVSISDVSSQDGGVYWCGRKSAHRHYRSSLRQIKLEVKISEPPPATTPSVQETTGSSTSSVQTTTASAEHQGGSWLLVIVAIVAVMCAAALVLSVVIYKRCEGSKNTTQNEDHNYVEIEERLQKPDSGTAPKTLYVTANFPTNVSGSHYSNILFEKSSGEVSGDTYSTVGGSVPCPTYSTVNHPSSFTEKPLYSTVNFSVRSSQGP
ncbi:uncharacterized protein LOC118104767 isoform X2 [Hippoglossus stenolepis]|uniref:uncharacterized protein LOC118104767 isoform X2 n=1 Tax=Hippoglossus stenolepis TaxID=195615 RepID=UPI001FAFB07A|nr:uncharacterized protein LOC118104767 isoform X2 [Hippoglossus stenolepis]